MGSPDLPDPGDDNLRPVVQIPVPMGISDESDNENVDAYNGYEPLPTMDDNMMDTNNYLEDDDDENSLSLEDNQQQMSMEAAEPNTESNPNLPCIESVDVEITRQIWSEPRPAELQLELDQTRTTQILTAMANFQLPNVAVPEWATGVPEERWKEELLARIRQRKEPQAK